MSKPNNKLALIIGGSRGIGRAIVLRLAQEGFDVWLTCRSNIDAAKKVQEEVEKIGRECRVFAFDIADHAAVKMALEKQVDARVPDVVVYNAGITKDNLFVFMTKEEWDSVLHTNLDGFYHVMHTVIFPMLREKRGRIVIISSTSGEIGQAGQVNYSASKAGLIGAAKALAREVARKNIWVNVVAPGVIDTEMTKDLSQGKILPMIPMQRFGTAEEVASIVTFLCAEKHMYIHGQVIGVNGGLAI